MVRRTIDFCVTIWSKNTISIRLLPITQTITRGQFYLRGSSPVVKILSKSNCTPNNTTYSHFGQHSTIFYPPGAGSNRNRGIAMLLLSRRYRDEVTIETGGQRVGSLLTATHLSAGEGRQIPQEGNAGPEPCWVGGARSAGLAWRTFERTRVPIRSLIGADGPKCRQFRVVFSYQLRVQDKASRTCLPRWNLCPAAFSSSIYWVWSCPVLP